MSKDTNKYHGCKENNLVPPFTIVSAYEEVKNYLLPFKEMNRMNIRNETVAGGALFLLPPVKYLHRNCLLRLKTRSHCTGNGIILLMLVQKQHRWKKWVSWQQVEVFTRHQQYH